MGVGKGRSDLGVKKQGIGNREQVIQWESELSRFELN